MADRKIRVGVVGVGRGMSFARSAPAAGLELVAICDTWETKLAEAGRTLGVKTYPDFADFLGHDAIDVRKLVPLGVHLVVVRVPDHDVLGI